MADYVTLYHESRAHKCSRCDKSFKTLYSQKRHEKTHLQFECKVCSKYFFEASELEEHQKIHTDQNSEGDDPACLGNELYKCSYCPKTLLSSRELKSHERVHTGDKRYQCRHCDKTYFTSSARASHEKTHFTEPSFKCELCEKIFSSQGHLKEHQSVHSQDSPFQCGVCEKSFKALRLLKAHSRVHADEKQFKCNQCDRSFTRLIRLEVHSRRMHGGDRPFSCVICSSNFAVKKDLTKHLSVHSSETVHKCTECDKSFAKFHLLQLHIRRMHSDDKPYACNDCGATFVFMSQLVRHMNYTSSARRCGASNGEENHMEAGKSASDLVEGSDDLETPASSEALSDCGACGECNQCNIVTRSSPVESPHFVKAEVVSDDEDQMDFVPCGVSVKEEVDEVEDSLVY